MDDIKAIKDSFFKRQGAYLKRLRKDCGLDQLSVSVACGLTSAQLLSNIETGKCGVPDRMLSKLAKIYNVPQKTMARDLTNTHLKRYIDLVAIEFEVDDEA